MFIFMKSLCTFDSSLQGNDEEDDDGDTDKYKLFDEEEEPTDNGKIRTNDGNEPDSRGHSEERKLLTEKSQARKRYPGSRYAFATTTLRVVNKT